MKDRLLKRFNRWATSTTGEIREPDANELMSSMQDDLEKMFNTRRGTVLIDDEYGLPDFSYLMNGYDAPDTEQIKQSIMDTIRKYDKRLQGIGVRDNTESTTQDALGFVITAVMRHKNQDLPFRLNALIRGDGSIDLSRR